MNAFSETMVQAKTKELRSTMRIYAGLSGLGALVPLLGFSCAVDGTLILHASNFLFNQLGLDDASLEKTANLTNTDLTTLQKIVNDNLDKTQFFTIQGLKEFLFSLPAVPVSGILEEYVRFIPTIGSLIAAPISIGTTYYVLGCILNKMNEVALLVVRAAAANIHKGVEDAGEPVRQSIFWDKDRQEN